MGEMRCDMEHLESQKERDEILATLTDKQKEVLWQYYKERKSDILVTATYQQSTEWELEDVEISEHYQSDNHGTEDKLYCGVCDHEVKYQYILYSSKEDEYKYLGVNCLQKFLSISDKMVRKIANKQYQLNFWLDDILKQVKENTEQKELYSQYLKELFAMPDTVFQRFNSDLITKPNLELIHDFKAVDLPIPTDIYEKLEKVVLRKNRVLGYKADAKRIWKRVEGEQSSNNEQSSNKKRRKISETEKWLRRLPKEQKQWIHYSRWEIEKVLEKESVISFVKIYELTKPYMDKLLEIYSKEESINLIESAINEYNDYKVVIDNDKQAIVKV